MCSTFIPSEICTDFRILYDDPHLLIVYKPTKLLVHRGWGRDAIVLVDLLEEHCGFRVFPIHRLDRATSGLLLFARDKETTRRFNAMFTDKQVCKHYLALVRGVIPKAGWIDHPIPRNLEGPRVPAFSAYRRIAQGAHRSLVEVVPITGRTHQLRRHLKHINHPILGDRRRGDGRQNRLHQEQFGLERMGLHAHRLSFVHPFTQQKLSFTCPLPDDLARPIHYMGLCPHPSHWLQELEQHNLLWLQAQIPTAHPYRQTLQNIHPDHCFQVLTRDTTSY
ncbi:MAG: pseudouridine synthase [Myxococcota bacterium]